MAIEKDIAIHHTEGVENVVDYVYDIEKTDVIKHGYGVAGDMKFDVYKIEGADQDIVNALDYAANLEKTVFELDGDQEILVSGIDCNPDTAPMEFQLTRDRYYRLVGDEHRVKGTKVDKQTGEIVNKESIEAYHVIQSFPALEDLDPRLVHQIGKEYAEQAFPGHQCVVTTHMNTGHLHNHIVVCAYSQEQAGRKYKMDMTRRREIRQINDELSIKYGLPILTERDLKNHEQGMTWFEWNEQRNRTSWKEKMRNDIKAVAELSKSWAEFTEYMQEAGYSIRETANTVSYTMPGSDTKKCRDRTLGEEYTKAKLCALWGEEIEMPVQPMIRLDEPEEEQPEKEPGTDDNIKTIYETAQPKNNDGRVLFHISRYTETGRRRSDLELIILAAIKLIQYFKDRFLDVLLGSEQTKGNPIYRPYNVKLQAMYASLNMVREQGIETKKDLKNRMSEVGANASHLKKEIDGLKLNLEFSAAVIDSIGKLRQLQPRIDYIGIRPEELFVRQYTDKEIAKNRADAQPMTPKMRRDLTIAIQEHELHLRYKYDHISMKDAQAILDYAAGKTAEKPDCLLNEDDAREAAIKQRYASILLRMEERQLSQAMAYRLDSIFRQNHIERDPADVNYAEAMKIISAYSSGIDMAEYFAGVAEEVNPYNAPFIGSDEKKELQELLDKRGFTLNRDIDYVMRPELPALLSYLNGQSRTMPPLLKPSQPIEQRIKNQIEELLELRGEACAVPVDKLSAEDGSRLYNYLLLKGYGKENDRPRELTPDQKFNAYSSRLAEEEKEPIFQYRETLNYLASYGLTLDNLDEFIEEKGATEEMIKELEKQLIELNHQYKNLAKLNYNINLAENERFTKGPLFKKEKEQDPEITNEQQPSEEAKAEDVEIEKAAEEEKAKRQRNEYFLDMDDEFFDRM